MGIQHEAAEVVIRIMGEVNNFLKAVKKTNKAANTIKPVIEQVSKILKDSMEESAKHATDSIEQFVTKSKNNIRELKSEFRELGRQAAKTFRKVSMPREGGGTKRIRTTRYGLGSSLPTDRDYSRAKKIAERMSRSANMVARPSTRTGYATSRRTQSGMGREAEAALDAAIRSGKVHPMTAKMNKGFAVHSMAAAMGQSPFVQPKGKYGPSISRADREKFIQPKGKYGPSISRADREKFIQPKGTYGPTISASDRRAHQFAVDQARGFYGSHGPSREQLYGPAVQPRGAYGPNLTPGMRAARRVQDRGIPPEIAARLAKAREIGGPLSVMPGTLGKIVAGFKAAAVSKDAFAANVFAKMPPCFMLFKNVASAVYRIGAWGFQRAWQGANLFGRTLSIFPSLVMKLASSVSSGFNRISNSIRNALGNLQAFGTKLRTAGIYTTAALTAPLVALGAGTVSEGASFDKAMTEAVARAGLNNNTGQRKIGQALRGQMEQAARRLSTSGRTSFSATELAQGYVELAAAGVEASHLLSALPQVTALAQAGEMSLAQTTQYLTTTMGALGITTQNTSVANYSKEMTRFSDVMVSVANATQASIETVAQSMTSDAGPAARAYLSTMTMVGGVAKFSGMEIEELGAIMGTYARQGILGAKAGNMAGRAMRLVTSSFTKKRNVWESLGIDIVDKNTGTWKKFADVIKLLEDRMKGMTGPQRTMFLQMLGLRDLSQKALEPLLGQSKAMKELENELRLGGSTGKMAAIQMEAFSNQIKVMWNHISDIKIDLFKILAPYLLVASKAVNQMATEFKLLAPQTKKAIVLVLAALASIGPILLGLGTMIAVVVAGFSLIGFILAPIAMLLSPIGFVIVALTALAVMWASTFKIDIAGMWIRATVALNQFAQFAMGFMQNFGPNMAAIWQWLQQLLARFSAWSAQTLEFLGATIAAAVQKYIPSLTKLWETLTGGGQIAADGMLASFGNFFMNVFGFIANFKDNMTNLFAWLTENWANIKAVSWENITTALTAVGTVLIGIMGIVGQELLKAMVPVGTFLWGLFQGIVQYMKDTLMGIKWDPVNGFQMTDRVGMAHETYNAAVADAQKTYDFHKQSPFSNRSAESKKWYEDEFKYAKDVAAAARDKRIREVTAGETMINNVLGTATAAMNEANKTNPAEAIFGLINGQLGIAGGAMKPLPKLPKLNLQPPGLGELPLQLSPPQLVLPGAGSDKEDTKRTELMVSMVSALNTLVGQGKVAPKVTLQTAGIA